MTMNEKIEQQIAGPLVWLSTLHAAAEVVRGRSERVRGIDASELEAPSEARRHIRPALRELEEASFRLGALQSDVLETVDELSAVVARFDGLLLLNRSAQLLEDIHRRLLSLYPEVGEALIEEVRATATAVRDAVADDGDVSADSLLNLCSELRRSLAL